ncbi:hypothetical protein [Burkholderia sp. Ac-20379]|uniref:hypothetical protein n=1 Tax=Burkholderia sp. Ac-20379 TaxID=2703900 RepID=UPI00198176CA|nr:hypothetical protein [Burkholderia sp. Ac-20379]MBN3724244.1 hypothetical protein [Burkholderia sp. Ac-20379]
MIDGLWSGLLGGFLGPLVSRAIGKLSYWKVFIFILALIYIFIFSVAILKAGFEQGVATSIGIIFTVPGVFVPIGFSAIFSFCALLHARSNKRS